LIKAPPAPIKNMMGGKIIVGFTNNKNEINKEVELKLKKK
jgi:hypothetical protein